jgi:hypothetical protein
VANGCQDYNDSHRNTNFYKHLVDIYKRHIQKKSNARKKWIKERKCNNKNSNQNAIVKKINSTKKNKKIKKYSSNVFYMNVEEGCNHPPFKICSHQKLKSFKSRSKQISK